MNIENLKRGCFCMTENQLQIFDHEQFGKLNVIVEDEKIYFDGN